MIFGEADELLGEIPISSQVVFDRRDIASHQPIVKHFVIGKVETQALKLPFLFSVDFCDKEKILVFSLHLFDCFVPELVIHEPSDLSPSVIEYFSNYRYSRIATHAITSSRDAAQLIYHGLLNIGP